MGEADLESFSYEFIFDNVDSCIIALDKNLIINNCNYAASRTIKKEAYQVIGKHCHEVLCSSSCFDNCPAKKALEKGSTCYLPLSLIKDGKGMTIPIRLSAIPIKNKTDNILGVLLMFTDQRDMYHTFYSNFQMMGLIGVSPQMREVFQSIETVASTNSNVLVMGNTGTGKELVANAIHKLSPRAENPFIKVNCAALSDSLLESELFGHEKGAFTGALAKRVGRFEAADGGTIFLDEISETTPGFQAKILRILQEREFERVGSSTSIKVDVRVIAATNKDLRDMVKQKLFREDLYYRINVFPIYLPPLNEREGDVKLLAEFFVNQFNTVFDEHKQKLSISKEAMNILLKYNFPGNIRELKNIIEYAFIKSTGNIIEKSALPGYLLEEVEVTDLQLKRFAIDSETRHILQVINQCNGNKSLAAKVLGISRKTLYNKLK